MKYSLRSLLSVVTVVAVLLGLWGENWRSCRMRQREHAEQANQLEEQVNAIAALASPYTSSPPPPPGLVQDLVQQARDHRSLEAAYRQAIWQPWKRWWIDDSRRAAAKDQRELKLGHYPNAAPHGKERSGRESLASA